MMSEYIEWNVCYLIVVVLRNGEGVFVFVCVVGEVILKKRIKILIKKMNKM